MSNTSENQIKSMKLKSNVIQSVDRMAKEQNRSFSNMVETLLISHPQLNLENGSTP